MLRPMLHTSGPCPAPIRSLRSAVCSCNAIAAAASGKPCLRTSPIKRGIEIESNNCSTSHKMRTTLRPINVAASAFAERAAMATKGWTPGAAVSPGYEASLSQDRTDVQRIFMQILATDVMIAMVRCPPSRFGNKHIHDSNCSCCQVQSVTICLSTFARPLKISCGSAPTIVNSRL